MYSGNSGVTPVNEAPSVLSVPRGQDQYSAIAAAQYVNVAVTGAATAGHAQLRNQFNSATTYVDRVLINTAANEVLYITNRVAAMAAFTLAGQCMDATLTGIANTAGMGDAAFTPGAQDIRIVALNNETIEVVFDPPFRLSATAACLTVVGDTTAFDVTFLFRRVT